MQTDGTQAGEGDWGVTKGEYTKRVVKGSVTYTTELVST